MASHNHAYYNKVQKFITKQISKLINKINPDEVKYYISFNKNNIEFYAHYNGRIVGTLSTLFLNPIHTEIYNIMPVKYNSLFVGDEIIKFNYISIDASYRKNGIATSLIKKAVEYIKNSTEYNQIYLNAMPMGFSGPKLNSLVDFFQKMGFKIMLREENNVFMYMTLI